MRDFFTGRKDSPTGWFFASLCPLRQFGTFANCLAMSATFFKGREDSLTGRWNFVVGHFFASLCPLRQYADCFSATFS